MDPRDKPWDDTEAGIIPPNVMPAQIGTHDKPQRA